MSENETILLCSPVNGEGGKALTTMYGELEDHVSVSEFLAAWGVRMRFEVIGPEGKPFSVHVNSGDAIGGPFFIGQNVIMTMFVVLLTDDTPLHCDDCARAIVTFLSENQQLWIETHHAEWWTTYCESQRKGPKRLN